jgi:hypothetical protein
MLRYSWRARPRRWTDDDWLTRSRNIYRQFAVWGREQLEEQGILFATGSDSFRFAKRFSAITNCAEF